MLRFLLGLIVAMSFSSSALAEHNEGKRTWQVIFPNLTVCDTLEQIVEQFNRVAKDGVGRVKGCGAFLINRPQIREYVFVQDYENDKMTAKIGHVSFPPPLGDQYIMYGEQRKPKPMGRDA